MSRQAGWRKPAGARYCGRPSLFGNPWPTERAFALGLVAAGERERAQRLAVRVHSDWLMLGPRCGFDLGDPVPVWDALPTLRGLDLLCWCRLDQPCHVGTLLSIANLSGPAFADLRDLAAWRRSPLRPTWLGEARLPAPA